MGFLLAFGIPAVLTASVRLAAVGEHPNAIVSLPLFIGYVAFPAVQALLDGSPLQVTEEKSARPGWRMFYRVLPLFAVPAQFAMVAVATAGFTTLPLNLFGRAAVVVATGLFSAMFAITVAHELIHRRHRFDCFCGGLLLSSVTFGTFKIVHLRIHHPYVGTPRDFATARLNQSIYSFWLQSLAGNFRTAIQCEHDRLARCGRPMWRSELVLWYGFTLLWLSLAVFFGGWSGGLFFLTQSVIAVMYLDCINYLQHYGLQRRILPNGRPEPMQEHHSWTQGMFLDDLVLFNLPRHSQHHTHPQRPFQLLSDSDAAPRYPYNYGLMTIMTLLPPLFRGTANRCLERFDAERRDANAR